MNRLFYYNKAKSLIDKLRKFLPFPELNLKYPKGTRQKWVEESLRLNKILIDEKKKRKVLIKSKANKNHFGKSKKKDIKIEVSKLEVSKLEFKKRKRELEQFKEKIVRGRKVLDIRNLGRKPKTILQLRKKKRESKDKLEKREINIQIDELLKEKIDNAQRRENRQIENLINNNNYQTIFNTYNNPAKNLSRQMANKVIDSIISEGQFIIKMVINGVEVFRPINTNTKFFLSSLLSTSAMLIHGETFGSDQLDNIEIQNIESITVEPLRPRRIIANSDGGFFPLINTSDIDLSRYQIYNQQQIYNLKISVLCLIHSFKLLGVDDTLINQVKLAYVSGCSIRKKDLKQISIMIKRDILLFSLNGHKIIKKTFKCANADSDIKNPLQLAIYKNHYFVYEESKFTTFSIKNYDEIKKLKNFNNITELRKGKNKDRYIRKRNIKKMNSLKLIVLLHEMNKFEKLDFSTMSEAISHTDLKNHIFLNNIESEQSLCLGDSSILVLKKLLENPLLTEIERITINTDLNNRLIFLKIESLEKRKKRVKKELDIIRKEKKKNRVSQKKLIRFYADCESYVRNMKEAHPQYSEGSTDSAIMKSYNYHKLYLLGVVSQHNDNVEIINIMDKRHSRNAEVDKRQMAVYDFLNILTKYGKNDALCYFHNLKYDKSILEKYLNITGICIRNNILYNFTVSYKGCEIEFRDSYKIASIALKLFSKTFNLSSKISKKEAIAYNYFNEDNNNKRIKTKIYRDLLPEDQKEIFDKDIKKNITYDERDNTFNPTDYYKEYLKLDCLVLKKGLEKMHTEINYGSGGIIHIFESLTLSGITDRYFNLLGAYDEVYQITGNLRAYVASAIVGGRVQVNPKYQKKIITGKIADMDAVSLYPSAMHRLCTEKGLQKGKAKQFKRGKITLANAQSKSYSILTVKINKVNKPQQLPMITEKIDSSNVFLNEAPSNPVIIDIITLEDYIKFQKIEYEILDGIYWDEGYNNKMGDIILDLFKERLHYKNLNNNVMANILKLMLNSAYGRTVMKQNYTKTTMLKNKTKKLIITTDSITGKKSKEWVEIKNNSTIENYICSNFNTIKSYRKINNSCFQIESVCADNSYNRGHIGCAILSMSKRIMNEVFDTANDNKLTLYYTDTDSIHLNYDDIPTLEKSYKERYNRDLIGQNLGQFHTDFNLDGAVSEIYARTSIFLGKKSYYDHLESTNAQGKIITGDHIRLKGICKEAIEDQINKGNYKSKLDMFKDLAKGAEIDFLMNPFDKKNNSEKVSFEYVNGSVRTRKEFIRKVKF